MANTNGGGVAIYVKNHIRVRRMLLVNMNVSVLVKALNFT